MDLFFSIIRAILALAVVLGLFGLCIYAYRRWAPADLLKLMPGGDRRMQVVESLSLGAQQRLVLVKLDEREHLILLGEGRMLDVATEAKA